MLIVSTTGSDLLVNLTVEADHIKEKHNELESSKGSAERDSFDLKLIIRIKKQGKTNEIHF